MRNRVNRGAHLILGDARGGHRQHVADVVAGRVVRHLQFEGLSLSRWHLFTVAGQWSLANCIQLQRQLGLALRESQPNTNRM